MVEVRIMQLSPQSSPTSFLVVDFTAKFQREYREPAGALNEKPVGKIYNFQPISSRISEMVQDRTKVTNND